MCDLAVQGSKELGEIMQLTTFLCDLYLLCKTMHHLP